MANEEVSNIGVKLTLDASNFNAGLGQAQGKMNSFQKQAATAASGATAMKAAAGTTAPTTVKVAVEPAQLQAALKTAASGLQSIHVPIDVDSRSISAMKTKITQGIGVIPVQLAATMPKTGPGSAQAIIGTVFSSMAGLSPQKGQILAKQAIEQIMPKREHGGPVSQGRPVIVGERRPEVFRPGASGFIERDVAQYRRHAAELAALEYQITQRQKNIQHAFRGARVAPLPPGTAMPMPLGTAPLRPGYVRGYHATKANQWGIGEGDAMARTAKQNLDAIRQHGLRMKNAQGHLYGEPDMNWFSNDIGDRGGYNEAYAVEAHLPEHWFRSDGRSRRWTNPPTIGGPSSNMAVGRDISRRRFASFNEPWMRHTRYMQDAVDRGQRPGQVMRQFGGTLSNLRSKGRFEAETQGWDQFVANSWRARHRAYGGEVTSLFGGSTEAMEEAAIKHFGVTDDVREAGYITPSGKFLDFSGRHEATGYTRQGDRFVPEATRYGGGALRDYLSGERGLDHRDASQFMPGVSQMDSVDRMKAMGFVRVWGTSQGRGGPLHTVGAEMSRMPTTAQINKLVGAAREATHASVDVYDPMGYRVENGSFSTQWPDDPVGGKKMGSFLRQAIELIEKNDMASEELRESMSLGAGFNPNAHRAAGGSVEAGMSKAQRSYLRNVREAAKRMSDPKNPYGRQSLEMGVQWYPEAQKWIAQQADTYGLPEPTVRGITASLSAGTAWSSNKTKALRILQANAAGTPFPYQTTLDAHKKAKAILEGADPWSVLGHTPKVGQFFLNTGGDLDAITIDRWALRTGTRGAISQAGRGPVRSGVEKAFRTVAKDMGIHPVQLQAALWIQEKAETDVAAGRIPKLAKYMEHGGFAKHLLEVERSHYRDPFETATYMDPETGLVHFKKSGTDSFVPFTQHDISDVSGRGLVMTHNHPGGWKFPTDNPRHIGNAPSIDDMSLGILTGAREIRATTPTTTWSVRPPSGLDTLADLAGRLGLRTAESAANVVENRGSMMMGEIYNRQYEEIAAGNISPEVASARHTGLLMDMLADKFGFDIRQLPFGTHRARGGRVRYGGFLNEVSTTAAEWAKDPFLAMMAYEAAHKQHRAGGGPAGGGLYIVNEQGDGSEGFVASRDAHMIPKFVMDRIPRARDGAQTGMINRPANSLFMPEQDGIIVPKWAVPYVPGLRHAASGFSNVHGVAVPPGTSAETLRAMNTYSASGPEALASQYGFQTWKAYSAAMAREVQMAGPARGREIPSGRSNVARDLAEGRAGLGKELPSRTAQGAVASIASFLFGGVQQLGQAQVRRNQAEQDYSKSLRVSTNQIQTYKGTLASYRDAILAAGKGTDEASALELSRARYITAAKPALVEAIQNEKNRQQALEKADAETRPTTGGIVKNLGVIIASTTLYGKAMSIAGAIIEPAADGVSKALRTTADTFTGFGATSARVTKGIGDQLNQTGGNLSKTFGDIGLQTRMSADFTAFLEKTLGGAVTAKAAAANQGQQSDLFRAAVGAGNAPSGLYGGFGGVLGTSFLGSELGGGKGFMETIAGDISALNGPKGGINPEDFGKGLLLAQNQQFRDYVTGKAKAQGNPVGAGSDLLGGVGDFLRNPGLAGSPLGFLGPLVETAFPKTMTPTSNNTGGFVNPSLLGKNTDEQTGIQKYLANLGEEAKRGAQAMGQASKFTYQLAKTEQELIEGTSAAAKSGDEFALSMALNGVVLKDAAGKVATGAEDFADTAKQMAKGATIPDMATFIKAQAQSLRAGFEVVAAQAAHQLTVGIPGQLGLQLAGQPFLPAAAGVLPPGVSAGQIGRAPGGIDIASTLAEAQAMQDELTTAGAQALKDLSDWIGQQPGMEGPYNVGGHLAPVAPIYPGQYKAGRRDPLTDTGEQAYVGGQTFDSGQAAFDYFTGQMQDAGKAIAEWQTKILNTQTAQQWAQFSNNLRLSNRAYADALALAGRGGGGRGSNGEMGGLERQQTLLGFMLTQKQINFQTALAGFQAPGLTSEERGARQAQAEAEARIAQKQLNIQERMFTVGAGRGVTDTGAALKLLKQEQAAQTAIAAAQKAIAAQQMKLSQAQAKAQVIQQKAEGNFTTTLQTAGGYVAQFGGSVALAVKTIYGALGYSKNRNGDYVLTNPLPSYNSNSGTNKEPGTYAAGYLGAFARGAVMTVGEAGPETVAILRNPRAMMMGGGFGGGGGGPVTVHLNLTVQGDISGDATVAKVVRAVEDAFNRKAARLGMRSFASASGG